MRKGTFCTVKADYELCVGDKVRLNMPDYTKKVVVIKGFPKGKVSVQDVKTKKKHTLTKNSFWKKVYKHDPVFKKRSKSVKYDW